MLSKEAISTLITISFVILALCITVVVMIIYYKRKQENYLKEQKQMQEEFELQLMKAHIEVQEHTSASLSEELHDNIGQLLSSTKMLITVSEKELSHIPDPLRTAKETLSKAIQDLRSLSKSLSKEWLNQFNLIDNLYTESERINSARNIRVSVETTLTNLPMPADAQVMLFRVLQEALQNSIKHASPTIIDISIQSIDSKFLITIKDNGKGFKEAELKNEGVGLRNMKHRTNLLGGEIFWDTDKGNGTNIRIYIPASDTTEKL